MNEKFYNRKFLQGIDRLFDWKSTHMDVFWDGIDVVKSLSRIIDLR